eukprot:TRINITY_DN15468_c0_g1_i1.p1 TRINITY_DN15468_c0_g1~~TRINITY_DN15468_c0_g1_i1.p1  ORF type:complete len:691 (+),score=152.78 TRINITY_DN15468_c0_g1_i1:92-2164(+)
MSDGWRKFEMNFWRNASLVLLGMAIAMTVALMSMAAWLLTLQKKERQAYFRHLSGQLRPVAQLRLLLPSRYSGMEGNVLDRLEQHRRCTAQAMQRRIEADAKDSAAFKLAIATLSGEQWHTMASPRTTGAELKATASQLTGIPRREVRLVVGTSTLADDELVSTALAKAGVDGEEAQVMLLRVHQHRVLTGAVDGTLRMLDFNTGSCAAVFRGHTKRASAIAVDWENSCALSTSADGSLCLWDLDAELESGSADAEENCGSTEPMEIFRGVGSGLKCLSVDWRSRRAMVGGGSDVELWDLDTSVCLATFRGHIGGVQCLSVDWDAELALSGSDDGCIMMWDMMGCSSSRSSYLGGSRSVRSLSQLDGHLAWVVCAELEPRRLVRVEQSQQAGAAAFWVSYVLTGSMEGLLKLWELREMHHEVAPGIRPQCRGRMGLHCCWTSQGGWGDVRCASINWDSQLAVSGAAGGMLKLWDLRNGNLLHTFASEEVARRLFHDVNSVAVDWQAGRAISGSAGGHIKVWDLLARPGGQVRAAADRSLHQMRGEVACVALEALDEIRDLGLVEEPDGDDSGSSEEELSDEAPGSDAEVHAPEVQARTAAEESTAASTLPPWPGTALEEGTSRASLCQPEGSPDLHVSTCSSCCNGLRRFVDSIFGRRQPMRPSMPNSNVASLATTAEPSWPLTRSSASS